MLHERLHSAKSLRVKAKLGKKSGYTEGLLPGLVASPHAYAPSHPNNFTQRNFPQEDEMKENGQKIPTFSASVPGGEHLFRYKQGDSLNSISVHLF